MSKYFKSQSGLPIGLAIFLVGPLSLAFAFLVGPTIQGVSSWLSHARVVVYSDWTMFISLLLVSYFSAAVIGVRVWRLASELISLEKDYSFWGTPRKQILIFWLTVVPQLALHAVLLHLLPSDVEARNILVAELGQPNLVGFIAFLVHVLVFYGPFFAECSVAVGRAFVSIGKALGP